MKNRIKWLWSIASVAGVVVLLGANAPRKQIANAEIARSHPDPLIVHEWGTFTSMQGVNGLELAGLHHEEELLPHFVHDVTQRGARSHTRVGERGTKAGTEWFERVTQKMETPVLYFYSKSKRKVDVKVDFPGGLISQWYPQASSQSIDYRAGTRGPSDRPLYERSYAREDAGDRKFVSSSSIEWKVDLIPRSEPAPRNMPSVENSEPWSFARDVDAAYVRNRGGLDKESEGYIFYRGLANTQLPVHVTTPDNDGSVSVQNYLQAEIPAAFLLEQSPQGARFKALGRLTSNQDAPTKHRFTGSLKNSEVVTKKLKAAMVAALVREGLFAKEAKGMVKTWSRSWFGSEGTRLVYIVPRKTTDRMLPISITPKPDKLVRVLVGRVEYIAPKTAREVRNAVRGLSAGSEKVRESSRRRIDRLGRFSEAHMHNLLMVLRSEASIKYKSALDKFRGNMVGFVQLAKRNPATRGFGITYENASAELMRIQSSLEAGI